MRAKIVLVLLLAFLFGLQLWQAWHTGITVDEPSHILAAHFYWAEPETYRVPDLAPLLKMVCGWVPLAIPDAGDARWRGGDEWVIANRYFLDLKDPFLQSLTFSMRLPLLAFPLLTVWLLWVWGRTAFGIWPALLGCTVFAFEPTALAHGSLVKNDVAAAFGYLAFWYAAWVFWRTPSWRTVLLLAACTLAGVLAKLSLVILLGIGPLVLLVRGWRRSLAYVLLYGLVVYLGLCAAYQFDVRLLQPQEISAKSADARVPWLFSFGAQVFEIVPVPRVFWDGCLSLLNSSAQRPPLYLLGAVQHEGNPLYFLVALLVKVPMALQVLIAWAAGFALWRRSALTTFLILPPILYIGLASMTGHQLGIRLILPALPFAALLVGQLAARHQRAVVLLVGLSAAESLARYPNGISFFNLWSGGPENGLRYLADSNLDWGQDLLALRQYVDAHGIGEFQLSYFGGDTPWRYFSDHQAHPLYPPWNDAVTGGKTVLEPVPGVYAISATLLPGQFFAAKYEGYYRKFLALQPTARAGYSIYIYDLR